MVLLILTGSRVGLLIRPGIECTMQRFLVVIHSWFHRSKTGKQSIKLYTVMDHKFGEGWEKADLKLHSAVMVFYFQTYVST